MKALFQFPILLSVAAVTILAQSDPVSHEYVGDVVNARCLPAAEIVSRNSRGFSPSAGIHSFAGGRYKPLNTQRLRGKIRAPPVGLLPAADVAQLASRCRQDRGIGRMAHRGGARTTPSRQMRHRDYQRDYELTLELVDIRTGEQDKQSAMLSKGYHHSWTSRAFSAGWPFGK